MRLELTVFTSYDIESNDLGRRFRFAVIDKDKANGYPANFICLLPSKVTELGKSNSVFRSIFRDKSLEQAKLLLTKALNRENDLEVKNELKRRLELLEPRKDMRKYDRSSKRFETKQIRKY
jgi:hypothetical protein